MIKRIIIGILITSLFGGVMLVGIYLINIYSQEKIKNEIAVEAVASKDKKQAFILAGTPEEVARGKEMYENMDKLVDPAYDRALNAWDLYKQEKYSEAEKEALRALKEARHDISRTSAHNTLLDIYEATKNYVGAIKEIDWLLDGHVNEYAKTELLERRQKLQKLLQEQQK